MRLLNKHAVLTGAGSGIGAACARKFAAEGCAVTMVDMDEERANRVADEISKAGGRAGVEVADVTDEGSLKAAFGGGESRFGGIDILVNNAGIVHPHDGDVTETSDDAWDTTMAVNLKGVFLGCKLGIPALLRQGGGAILNTASIVALVGSYPSQIAYTASKGAVVSMTREISVCYARRGIRANVICPGVTETDMTKQLYPGGLPERLRSHLPMGRMALTGEIADVAAYLVSDEASYVNGQVVSIDGGLTSAYLCPPD
jgi:NAD(P)-dependent dehydrogenase (short-subunit alcohol dehydrogenase family)